ncbi:MAG: methyltransferase [Hyphomicrobiales bacterium]|nr:MAG: methyltransferase [Hyphomicrobiales bacterium]
MQVTEEDGQMFAPAAGRNRDAIEAVLAEYLPKEGNVLEIASGTGQHISHFAQKFTNLNWQPSDIDTKRRASVDAWRDYLKLENISAARHVDIAAKGWVDELDRVDFIMMVNLLHLISQTDMVNFMCGAADLLHKDGRIFIYGPFMREGVLTSDGDEKFHADLQAQNSLIGYKNIEDVIDNLLGFGLEVKACVEMPANNIALVAQLVN